jgi:hypothetical protein
MTLFDGVSLVAQLLPKWVVVMAVLVALLFFQGPAKRAFASAVQEKAAQVTSLIERALAPELRNLKPHPGCYTASLRCKQSANKRHTTPRHSGGRS